MVDDSPVIRETIGIVLGPEYDVLTSLVQDYAAFGLPQPVPDLIVAGRASSGRCGQHSFPAGVPVLWIDGVVEGRAGGPDGSSLRAPFTPSELRRRVAQLLSPPRNAVAGSAAAARLRPPFVAGDAARAIAEALATELPLHLVGEPGVGKHAVARAVHAAWGCGRFLAVPAAEFDIAALAPSTGDRGTLFIDRVEELGARAQQELLAILEPGGLVCAAAGRLRLITSTTGELGAAADAGRFASDLYYGITVLTVLLAPLRERRDDITPLSHALAAELAPRLARSPPVTFTSRALDRLANYLWPGNLAELEAVLARTLALCRRDVVDADDLRFDASRWPPPEVRTAQPRDASAALGSRPLDLIVNELAHEFKNPLVTIKTFAHHLCHARPSSGAEQRVARLTGEAVAQIDQALENLLEFTRLEPPVPQSVSLAAVVDRALVACGPALAAHAVQVDHPVALPGAVRGDPRQLAYALGNLVRALTRDLTPPGRVVVRDGGPAALVIDLPPGTDPLASHLGTLLDRAADTAPALPLGVAIASAVLERNGAQVAVAAHAPSSVTVRFTPADDDGLIAGNGSTPHPGR